MILLKFNIRNPWSDCFQNLRYWTGKFPVKYKHWEFEILQGPDIINLHLGFTHRQDHAGLDFELSLFGYGVHFMIYDERHWNWDTNSWET
jgi:hypothetical protein